MKYQVFRSQRAGSAINVRGQAYFYSVEQDSGLIDLYGKQSTLEVKLTASGGTNEWVKTYYDFAGRPFQKVWAARYAVYGRDSHGEESRTSRSDKVPGDGTS